MSNFSKNQTIRKTVVESAKGIVSSQHRLASEVGAKVLSSGGNAIDAAVATSFALGVVEPWMSGPGGGGYMVVKMANESQAKVVNFGMCSPKSLDPATYPLSGSGVSSDLFSWPSVVDDRNVVGGGAVAVPGHVDGMRLALEAFGTKSWAVLLQPAIGLARDGLLVDWYAQLMIAPAAEALSRFPKSKETFLTAKGFPVGSAWTALRQERCSLDTMADMLTELANEGPRSFYEGSIAAGLARDVQHEGGALSVEDLKAYRATISDTLDITYKDSKILLTPELTAGPAMSMALKYLEDLPISLNKPGPETYAAYAKSLKHAYSYRLSNVGDTKDDAKESCTTSFSVVDSHGNMVSVTQTLLSVFGSRLMVPSAGVLMNNGIMWFDPEPGRPNSIGPGKRCLSNMCPVIVETGEAMFALGAAGGRKIFPAVMQLTSFVTDYRMSLEEAFHTPRIDFSGGDTVIVDESLPDSVHNLIGSDYIVARAPRTVYPYNFACPSGIAQLKGKNQGMTEIMSAWSDSVAEDDESAL